MKATDLLTDTLVKQLFPHAEFLKGQKKGSSADYLLDTEFLEVKLDLAASKTGNIFVEVANEKDGVTYDSGITLSAKNNYSVLYILPLGENQYSHYLLKSNELLTLAKEHGKLKKTRPFANGNRAGFHGVGYILPVAKISTFLLDVQSKQ